MTNKNSHVRKIWPKWKFHVEPHTIGYMCKELQIICYDYDGGMTHSKHTVLYSNKDFPDF